MVTDRAGRALIPSRGRTPGRSSRGWSSLETHDRRAPPSPFRTRVRVGGDQRVAGEQRLDDRALDARTPAVDQPHLGEAAGVGGLEVLRDDRGNVAGRERVKVERVL